MKFAQIGKVIEKMAEISREDVKRITLDRLRSSPSLKARVLARDINVSYHTVRRAFKELIAKGKVGKFHGGVTALSPLAPPIVSFTNRDSSVRTTSIQALAQLINDGQAIILDFSPTTLQLAQYVPTELNAIIITNSPAVAMSFSNHPQVEKRIIGGRVCNGVLMPTEKEEVKLLEMVHAAVCVLGECNLDKEVGISTSDRELAKLRATMMANASNVILEVSDEKLDTSAPYIVEKLNKLTHIIPYSSVSDKRLKVYEELGIKIIRG